MAKRLKIALRFSYNEGWIAGSYYVMNLVHALKTLPPAEQPALLICATKNDFEIIKSETQYPFLHFFDSGKELKLPSCKRLINLLNITLFGKYLFDPRINHFDAKFIYMVYGYPEHFTNLLKKVYWIPDFQEKYLPHLFNVEDLSHRQKINNFMMYGNNNVVFSSLNAKTDADKFFGNHNANCFVLPFAVTLPDFDRVSFNDIKLKYNLPDRYFFCPNQFWQHKNHLTVLKALSLLKSEGISISVLFSGKEEDRRNANHIQFLKQYSVEHNLSDCVKFLGFLDRKDQLCIMKNSILVIQPSLFEGWSTVVEDSKALNKFVVLSNLDVHIEQISKNCVFFEKENQYQLADLLKIYWCENPITTKIDYQDNITRFARNFIDISSKIKEL